MNRSRYITTPAQWPLGYRLLAWTSLCLSCAVVAGLCFVTPEEAKALQLASVSHNAMAALSVFGALAACLAVWLILFSKDPWHALAFVGDFLAGCLGALVVVTMAYAMALWLGGF